MTHISLPALTAAFLACGFAVVLECRRKAGEAAPPAFADVPTNWEWVAAEPGVNLYINRARPGPVGAPALAWLRHERSPSLASVGGELLELREFDCQRHRSRLRFAARSYHNLGGIQQLRVTAVSGEWLPFSRGPSASPIFNSVCGRIEPRPLIAR
jgi:hypothetical protein